MGRERPGHTLQTSALINEAYIRLIDWKNVRWQNRAHFFAVSAQLMRRILVDFARQRNNLKRGGDALQVSLTEAKAFAVDRGSDLVALNEALTALAKMNHRKGQVVEMRFFGGLSIEEVAEVLKVSNETVMRDWRFAKVWLLQGTRAGRLSMKAERWEQVEQLYHSALEKEADQRSDFLAKACAGDEGLRREVESLLAYENRAENFIESPALDLAAKLVAQDQNANELAGQTINQYKIISAIGAAAWVKSISPRILVWSARSRSSFCPII